MLPYGRVALVGLLVLMSGSELNGGLSGKAELRIALDALAARYGPAEIDPAMAAVRDRLVGTIFSPSHVFGSLDVWTVVRADEREVLYRGQPQPGGRLYAMTLAPRPSPTSAPGDWQRRILLRGASGGTFEWEVTDELALGGLDPTTILHALDDASHRMVEAALASDRGLLVRAYPRTSAVLARVVKLDAVLPVSNGARQGSVILSARVQPWRLRRAAPALAQFVERELVPTAVDLVLDDGGGSVLAKVHSKDGLIQLGVGPFDAGPRSVLAAHGFAATIDLVRSVSVFKAGFRSLRGDSRWQGAPARLSASMVFAHEPEWVVPSVLRPFLADALSAPFGDAGAHIGVSLERHDSSMTRIAWRYSLKVRESRALRWLQGLGGTVAESFHAEAEVEAREFARDLFLALRDDLCNDRMSRSPVSKNEPRRGGVGARN